MYIKLEAEMNTAVRSKEGVIGLTVNKTKLLNNCICFGQHKVT